MAYPIIGITASVDTKEGWYRQRSNYVSAIEQCGGLPVILPPSAKRAEVIMTRLNGLLLAGGGDLDPLHFNEDPQYKLHYDHPLRDRFELLLIKAALAQGRPILGICRGIQVLNVALGGTLYQEIHEQVEGVMIHQHPRGEPTHEVKIEQGSLLARLSGKTKLRVNSFHHQAVQTLATGLIVSARANDGIIEAIEDPRHHFVLGVQWHPERIWKEENAAHALFAGLIEAAQR